MSDCPSAPTLTCQNIALRRDLAAAQEAVAIVAAIEKLRKYGSIHLHANNREVLDHNGHEAIGVSAATPEWFDREFKGATLLEALTNAVEEKERKDT